MTWAGAANWYGCYRTLTVIDLKKVNRERYSERVNARRVNLPFTLHPSSFILHRWICASRGSGPTICSVRLRGAKSLSRKNDATNNQWQSKREKQRHADGDYTNENHRWRVCRIAFVAPTICACPVNGCPNSNGWPQKRNGRGKNADCPSWPNPSRSKMAGQISEPEACTDKSRAHCDETNPNESLAHAESEAAERRR